MGASSVDIGEADLVEFDVRVGLIDRSDLGVEGDAGESGGLSVPEFLEVLRKLRRGLDLVGIDRRTG